MSFHREDSTICHLFCCNHIQQLVSCFLFMVWTVNNESISLFLSHLTFIAFHLDHFSNGQVLLFVFDRGSHFSTEALWTGVFKTFANLLTTQREKFICVVHLENMIHCLILCQLVHWLCVDFHFSPVWSPPVMLLFLRTTKRI